VISKTGGVVTVHATVIAETYEWSSVDVTDTSASDDTVFVHWSDVGDIGYYGNSEGLCGGVSDKKMKSVQQC
jgi:hypothetical protein